MDKAGSPPPSYVQPPIQTQPAMIAQPLILGPQPCTTICPSCHAQITTSVELENSTKTHLVALVLCLVCFPCVCVPYCVDSCKSKNHYCPNCKAYLGRYES